MARNAILLRWLALLHVLVLLELAVSAGSTTQFSVSDDAADAVDATTTSFGVTMTAISVLGATPAAAAVPAARLVSTLFPAGVRVLLLTYSLHRRSAGWQRGTPLPLPLRLRLPLPLPLL